MNQGYIVIIAGSAAFVYGLYCLFRMFAFKKWEVTDGKIIASYKSTRDENFQNLEDAEITYEYEVCGKKYKSSTIQASGEMSGTPSKTGWSDIDKLLLKYPPGSNVRVYYNPSIPRMACLELGGGEAVFIGLVFGPLAVLVGYFFFL